MIFEQLIDLPMAGARAQVLGLAGHQNPFLSTDADHIAAVGDWLALVDALKKFGGEPDDVSREGRLTHYVGSGSGKSP
ncbi:CrpP-related protein [Rhizobium leguminosarum]